MAKNHKQISVQAIVHSKFCRFLTLPTLDFIHLGKVHVIFRPIEQLYIKENIFLTDVSRFLSIRASYNLYNVAGRILCMKY